MLRALREHKNESRRQPEADAILVFGLPRVLLGEDRHRNAAVEDPVAEVGDRDLTSA